MHELSVAEELLDIIEARARSEGVRRVVEVNLRIGDYSGIMPESLEFAFEVLSRGGITEGARLNIERTRPLFTCLGCGSPVYKDEKACPRCGGEETRIEGGDQLELLSFEGD